MKGRAFIKNNMFACFMVIIYGMTLWMAPKIAVKSIYNSAYYIKEMLMIMPVIFVLTALLDTWVPTETISRYLGKAAKSKGTFVAFVIGSVSAGPIYAGFPFCYTLYRKGASIQNVVIMLSAWAVVKLPMLLNEAKFLGGTFMVLRWILTVMAILIFSKLMGWWVKDADIPCDETPLSEAPHVNTDACMGCGLCVKRYPSVFIMVQKRAEIRQEWAVDQELLNAAVRECPVKAIVH